MFSNGSQPETGFPRRYKIAADVEFITSATIISRYSNVIFLCQLDCDIHMSYSSFPEVRNRKETENGLGERPSMVHPNIPYMHKVSD